MFESMFWGFALRFVECLANAAPFILAGFLTAAIFERLLGPQSTRRLFGDGTKRSLVTAWGMGMLLPVCSLGVIPVVREMRKDGISGGTILAFAISAPLFNPLSILYGLTLSEPLTIIAFAFCSLLVVTAVGLVWDRIFPDTTSAGLEGRPIMQGIRRMIGVGAASARAASGASLGYILVGVLGSALLGAFLPAGSLQRSMSHDNPWSPLLMTTLAVPVYATPMRAMSQLGMMFQHGNSVGAAFVLLVLGAGMNLGLLVWMVRTYGAKRAAGWFALLLGIVVVLAYTVDKPLYPQGIEAADHTHAFDVYCCPFYPSTASFRAFESKLDRDIEPYEWQSLAILGALILSGAALRRFDRNARLERWLECEPADASRKFDVVLPAPVLGGIALLGLVVISVLGCFTYYPEPETAFEEMGVARTEALAAAMSGNAAHASHWIDILDDGSRKLEVGVYLRNGHLSEYHRMKAELLREKLEILEHEVQENDKDLVLKMVNDVSATYHRMRTAFLKDR